jgi:hypothetical protein
MKLKLLVSIMKYSVDDRCEGMRIERERSLRRWKAKGRTDLFQKVFFVSYDTK